MLTQYKKLRDMCCKLTNFYVSKVCVHCHLQIFFSGFNYLFTSYLGSEINFLFTN